MTEEEKNVEQEAEAIKINLVWDSAEDLPTHYVNQVIASHSGPEFYLIFGEVITPAVQGQIGGKIPTDLKVKPIVKLAIPHQMMVDIAKVIAENAKNFAEKFSKSTE